MNVTFRVLPIPDDIDIMQTVAVWSLEQWGADFPDDSLDTYINLYKESVRATSGIPRVLVAMNERNAPVGTITFIADDDLPGAPEPGPWLAALFVLPESRSNGVGQALVDAVIDHARLLGHHTLYLYTDEQVSWYEALGWKCVRQAALANHEVTVMSLSL